MTLADIVHVYGMSLIIVSVVTNHAKTQPHNVILKQLTLFLECEVS